MFKVLSRLVYLLVVMGCFLTVGAVFNTTPPFNECPQIGLSPSCAVLYVFNANGTVSVYGDASVSPYDGSEDTLVGVLNNSSQTIPSLTLSGVGVNGIPIFGLEGDGICTYAPFTGSGYCSGAYYKTDPGDYAGPNQTITNISSDQKTGTINFIGGLAPGAATYFSLEDRLSTSTPPVVGGNVTTTPAPPSVLLMLTAMAGLILYQGRRWFAQMFA